MGVVQAKVLLKTWLRHTPTFKNVLVLPGLGVPDPSMAKHGSFLPERQTSSPCLKNKASSLMSVLPSSFVIKRTEHKLRHNVRGEVSSYVFDEGSTLKLKLDTSCCDQLVTVLNCAMLLLDIS